MKYISGLLNAVIAASIIATGLTTHSVASGETAGPTKATVKYTQEDFD